MSTIYQFEHIATSHTLYRGKDCMRKFWDPLKELAKNITGFE